MHRKSHTCWIAGQPTLAKVRVTRADLLWGTASEEYVSLVAKCTVGGQTVQKKTLVYVSMWSHSVFLQTDKPIYTPRQTGGWSSLHYQTGRCMGGPIYTSIETDGWSNLHPRQTDRWVVPFTPQVYTPRQTGGWSNIHRRRDVVGPVYTPRPGLG